MPDRKRRGVRFTFEKGGKGGTGGDFAAGLLIGVLAVAGAQGTALQDDPSSGPLTCTAQATRVK